MTEPSWVRFARRYIGLAEIPGRESNPTIQRWLRSLRAWWDDDSTPWCGTFVAHCLTESGCQPPAAWYRARAYLNWGLTLHIPAVGCVAVLDRKGGGHVGFVVGRTYDGRIAILGGNQGDQVNVCGFDSARVLGWRWPEAGVGGIEYSPLPRVPAMAAGGEA